MTSEDTLDTTALHQISECLWPVRYKWCQIGDALKIDDATLEVIRDENPHRVDNCIRSMLVTWLRNSNACWKALAEALRSPLVGVTVEG